MKDFLLLTYRMPWAMLDCGLESCSCCATRTTRRSTLFYLQRRECPLLFQKATLERSLINSDCEHDKDSWPGFIAIGTGSEWRSDLLRLVFTSFTYFMVYSDYRNDRLSHLLAIESINIPQNLDLPAMDTYSMLQQTYTIINSCFDECF